MAGHSLGGEIPESLFDENGPLDRETAQRVRETLEEMDWKKIGPRPRFLTVEKQKREEPQPS